MKREAEKIEQYGLTVSKILASHIYTGANFVPLNGICRSHPPEILALLKGEDSLDRKPANKMCSYDALLHLLVPQEAFPEHRAAREQVLHVHFALVLIASADRGREWDKCPPHPPLQSNYPSP
jgi:hypothetical protein